MSDKIVSLHGHDVSLSGRPNENIIAKLEKALQEAREGKMQSMAIVGLDGERGFMVDHVISGHSGLELLGALHVLAHRINVECEQ